MEELAPELFFEIALKLSHDTLNKLKKINNRYLSQLLTDDYLWSKLIQKEYSLDKFTFYTNAFIKFKLFRKYITIEQGPGGARAWIISSKLPVHFFKEDQDILERYHINLDDETKTLQDYIDLGEFWFDIDDPEDMGLHLLNRIIEIIGIKPKRGDLIHFPERSPDRNNNKFIYDGARVIELEFNVYNEYGSIPRDFKVITEFPFNYWNDLIFINFVTIDKELLREAIMKGQLVEEPIKTTLKINYKGKSYIFVFIEGFLIDSKDSKDLTRKMKQIILSPDSAFVSHDYLDNVLIVKSW